MSLGQKISSGTSLTKALLHLDGNPNDDSGNGNNGTATNISYAADKLGQCGVFNGTNHLLKGPLNMAQTGGFTIGGWLNITSLTAGSRYIYAFAPTGGGVESCILCRNNGQIAIILYDQSFKFYRYATVSGLTGSWRRYILSVGAAQNHLFIDGLPIALSDDQGNFSSGYATNNFAEWSIMSNVSGGSRGAGRADEVFYEARLWTQQDAERDYAQGVGRYAIL